MDSSVSSACLDSSAGVAAAEAAWGLQRWQERNEVSHGVFAPLTLPRSSGPIHAADEPPGLSTSTRDRKLASSASTLLSADCTEAALTAEDAAMASDHALSSAREPL